MLFRSLSAASAAVVLVTVGFLRPWPWALAVGCLVVAGLAAIHWLLGVLEDRPSPADWGSIAAAMAAVVVGSSLVTLGGASVVVDAAAVVGGRPAPVPHDGIDLARPVLYQLFWGPGWSARPAPPALGLAAAFGRGLPSSRWARDVEGAGFGVRSFAPGGCWVDPAPPAAPPGRRPEAASTATGLFPTELRLALSGHRRLRPCPGDAATPPPRVLPPDAVVALWLDPATAYGLGGVSAHGVAPWPGRPSGLPVVGLTGGFASWGRPACRRRPSCLAVPPYASPTYALSHEVVETVTNPFGDGWFADPPLPWSARYVLDHGPGSLLGTAPVFQGEVADLCEPGQPDAGGPTAGTLGPSALPTAPFYRPGRGCTG